jgi:hypothetical protein
VFVFVFVFVRLPARLTGSVGVGGRKTDPVVGVGDQRTVGRDACCWTDQEPA